MLVDEFLDMLKGVTTRAGGWMALCPVHEERTPSMSIAAKEGKILIHCHGCGASAKKIVGAMGLMMIDLRESHAGNDRGERTAPARIRREEKPADDSWRQTYEAALWRARADITAYEPLAERWGVKSDTLGRMEIGVAAFGQMFYFPMCNSAHELIGVRTYEIDGKKRALRGSKNGLFLAVDEVIPKACRVFVCEGLSDTAAMLDLGLYVIGRPSCTSGGELVKDMVKDRHVVMIADDDTPGREGAKKLAGELRQHVRSIRCMCPPSGGDARGWKAAGATREDVVSLAMSRRAW